MRERKRERERESERERERKKETKRGLGNAIVQRISQKTESGGLKESTARSLSSCSRSPLNLS
jgi:hypothetical protein